MYRIRKNKIHWYIFDNAAESTKVESINLLMHPVERTKFMNSYDK